MSARVKKRSQDREKRTIKVMIGMYCDDHHASSGQLCAECKVLFNYALERIEQCPHKEAKPACAKCPIHCYEPAVREQIRKVMRFSGPRMLTAHPVLAVLHILHSAKGSMSRSGGQ